MPVTWEVAFKNAILWCAFTCGWWILGLFVTFFGTSMAYNSGNYSITILFSFGGLAIMIFGPIATLLKVIGDTVETVIRPQPSRSRFGQSQYDEPVIQSQYQPKPKTPQYQSRITQPAKTVQPRQSSTFPENICQYCGSKNEKGSKFCFSCGKLMK